MKRSTQTRKRRRMDSSKSEESEVDVHDFTSSDEEFVVPTTRKSYPKRARKAAAKDDSNIPLDLVEKIHSKRPRYDPQLAVWKRGLKESTFADCIPALAKLKEQIDERSITAEDIVKSNMNNDDKLWALEHLSILQHIPSFTEEHYDLKMKLYRKLSGPTTFTDLDKKHEFRIRSLSEAYTDIKLKILRSDHSDKVKAVLYKRFEQVEHLSKADEEYMKRCQWIEWVLSIPTKVKPLLKKGETFGSKLLKVKHSLDQNMYGMDKVKERILELVGAMLTNPAGRGRCIALVGPPGVGKTELARCLGDALELPFEQISLGGVTDQAVLNGHSSTYIGAKPGSIMECLSRFKGNKNGILYFDEFDKLNVEDPGGRNVVSSLLHTIDFTQNHEYRDHYIGEFPIDLSNVFFVISLNDETMVDEILLDRIPLIRFNGYNIRDKASIGMKFFLPKHLANLHMDPSEVVITQEMMEYIVKKINDAETPGVRKLGRKIKMILERVNVLKHVYKTDRKEMNAISYSFKGFKIPLKLDKNMINKLLKV